MDWSILNLILLWSQVPILMIILNRDAIQPNHPGHKDHNESLYTNYERLWQLFDELHAAKPGSIYRLHF